ncbi:hypothetical protein EV2_032781 [Malus domestica]
MAKSAGCASAPDKVKICTKILGKVEECRRTEAHFMGWARCVESFSKPSELHQPSEQTRLLQPKVPITQLRRLLRMKLARSVINQDEVVAEAVVLDEVAKSSFSAVEKGGTLSAERLIVAVKEQF